MIASTLTARKIIRQAFALSNVNVPKHSYTEKTSEIQKDRRSIVYSFSDAFDANQVSKYARELIEDAGYVNSKVTLTTTFFGTHRYYVRVIAVKS